MYTSRTVFVITPSTKRMETTRYTITFEQRDRMLAAQDEAAKDFWAYPDAHWQAEFQAGYLLEHYNVPQAQTPDGVVWGEW